LHFVYQEVKVKVTVRLNSPFLSHDIGIVLNPYSPLLNFSRSTAKMVQDRSMGYYGNLQEVTTGLLRGPISNPLRSLLLPFWGSQPPVKTCIINFGQMVPDTMVVCTDSLCHIQQYRRLS